MFYVVEYLLHCLEQIYYSGILLFYWMIFVASSVKEFCCLMVKSRIFLMWCDNSTFVWFSFDSRRWITVLSIRLNVNWSRWMLHHGSRQLINDFKSEIKKKNVNLLVSLKQFQGIPIFQTVDAIRADTFLYDFLHVTRINSVDLKLM